MSDKNKTFKLYTELKKIGHNGDHKELVEYCNINKDEIIQHVGALLCSNGVEILDIIFIGISSQKYKIKVIDAILKAFRAEATSLTHCGDVISRLLLELLRCPVEDLIQWYTDSLNSILDDSDINMIWRDVLPECLNTISTHGQIRYCGTEMTGTTFKEQCVNTLCHSQWKEKQLVQLTAMFNDIQLSQKNHNQVVNKICSFMTKIAPETLPPLVHQLLRLCKVYDIEVVLAHLSQYFNQHLYSKLKAPALDSESSTMDDIVEHYDTDAIHRCLSTCLYHIAQGTANPELIKKHLKQWPRCQVLKSPFLIDVALAMSDKGSDFRIACLDVVKGAIEQRVLDGMKCKESAWVKSAVPPGVDVISLLDVLINESKKYGQITVLGLINLAFTLLATSRTKQVAPTCWSYGNLILARLANSQPETAQHILSQLADRLVSDLSQRQYIECLHTLCKQTPLSLERGTQLGTILENCQPTATDYRPAAEVLDAVHPLLNFSTKVRDYLVLVCRKGLFSRNSLRRCLALSGFLSLLRHIRLPTSTGGTPGMSDQYSSSSCLSQLSIDIHATQLGLSVTSRVRNEALCMEVVSIIRRCLQQDAAVKQLLYTHIFDCVKDKISLHEPILEMFYEHVNKYISADSESPVLWDKCVKEISSTTTLVEPIGSLLYSIAQFIQQDDENLEDILGSQSVDFGSAYIKNNLLNLVNKISKCGELCDLSSLDSDTCLSEFTTLKVQQCLQCYEALIAHQIMLSSITKEQTINMINKLLKAYNSLLDHMKPSAKSGKKGAKGVNDTTKSQKSQKEKGKPGQVKLTDLKDKVQPFKPLPCLWNMKLCVRVLELLYSEQVPWCEMEPRSLIRSRREFHLFAIRNIQSAIKNNDRAAKSPHLVIILNILYKRTIVKFQDVYDFSDQTVLACVELFNDCFNLLVTHNPLRYTDHILSITDHTHDGLSTGLAAILDSVHNALQSLDTVTNSQPEVDAGIKKLYIALFHLVSLVVNVPQDEVGYRCSTVITELENYIRNSKKDCSTLLHSLLVASSRERQDAPLFDDLMLKLKSVLGQLFDKENSTQEHIEMFPFMEVRGGHTALIHVCALISHRIQNATLLVTRAKELRVAKNCVTASALNAVKKELNKVNTTLVLKLCQLATATNNVCQLKCNIGVESDRVIQVTTRLYTVLVYFIKHLNESIKPAESALLHNIRLERLLKLSGRRLTNVVDIIVTYIQESQPAQESADRVLRDTRLIPRLVLEVETYVKNVTLLANKAKVDYQQFVSLSTARDFRINIAKVKEAFNAHDASASISDEDEALSEEERDSSSSAKRRRVS